MACQINWHTKTPIFSMFHGVCQSDKALVFDMRQQKNGIP